MALVRKIIKKNKRRHDQDRWIGLPESYEESWHPLEAVAAYAMQAVPEMPEDPANPICMTTACVAGWAAVLGSPPGTQIRRTSSGDAILKIPGQVERPDMRQAAIDALGINTNQAEWLFNGSRKRKQVLAALKWLPDHQDATHTDLLREFGGSS